MFACIFTTTRKLESTAPPPSKTFFLEDSGPVRVVIQITSEPGGWLTDFSVLVIKKRISRLERLKKGFGRNKKCIFVKHVQNWERRKCVWTAQARADRRSCGVMETTAPQPRLESRRRAKPM